MRYIQAKSQGGIVTQLNRFTSYVRSVVEDKGATIPIGVTYMYREGKRERDRLLTDNVEMHEVAHVRDSGYLAFVDAGVPVLGILYLQHPVVRVGVMYRPEALVVRVRIPADRQQVDVPVSHPRHLQSRHL